MDETSSNFKKKRFLSQLKGEGSLIDVKTKTIYLFEQVTPTRPGSIKTLAYISNNRHTFTAYTDQSQKEPVLEVVNAGSFRLLNGWTIDEDSRANVLHAGWTEELDKYETQKHNGINVQVRRFNKFLVLESTIDSKSTIPLLQYEVIGRRDPTEITIETKITTAPDDYSRTFGQFELLMKQDLTGTNNKYFHHAVINITNALATRIYDAASANIVFTVNLGTVIRDGQLIQFPLNT